MFKIADDNTCITHVQAREAFLLNYLWGNLPSIQRLIQAMPGTLHVLPNSPGLTWSQLDLFNKQKTAICPPNFPTTNQESYLKQT